MKTFCKTAGLAGLLVLTPALALAKPAAPASAAKSAMSQECSKEADAKGLHGKEREKFRYHCKKGNGAASATTPATPAKDTKAAKPVQPATPASGAKDKGKPTKH